MAWFVLVAVLAFPVMEITLFVKSATTFGVLPTLAAAILAGVAGMALLRHQGLATALRARAQFERGEMPVSEVFDGLCLAAAGVLLLLPGFASDFLALLLLLPPVRAVLRHRLAGRVLAGRVTVTGHRPAGPRPSGPAVIEGDFHEVPPPSSPPPPPPPSSPPPPVVPSNDP
jgi:UPF0716 protein FxsA